MAIQSAPDSYREIRKKARKSYLELKSVSCLKLDGEPVFFSEAGFRHLIQKDKKYRPKSEQRRRFALLPYAADIIADPSSELTSDTRTIFLTKKSFGRRIVIPSEATFWAFTNQREGKIVKVIVRRVGNGNRHFYSIYAKKQKAPSKDGEGISGMPATS